MLSIGQMSSGKEEYYLGLAAEDYYTEGGEPPGRWYGEGATALGLEGEVRGNELSNVFRGFSPDGNQPLVRNAGAADRRAGFDFTFSAPKSVSVAAFVAEDSLSRAIRDCHERAVAWALGEAEALCGVTRTGAGGEGTERAKLAFAVFEHSTARAEGDAKPDMHLHSHCLLMNVCVDESGNTRTVDGRRIFARNLKMALGALYRAELFAQIEDRLGLLASKGEKDKVAELKLVSGELRHEFSKRRQVIETLLDERMASTAASAAVAALDSRQAKQEVNRSELIPHWRAVAERFGLTPEVIRAELGQGRERDKAAACAEGLTKALTEITDQQSHFTYRDLLRHTASAVEAEGVGAELVRLAVQAALRASPEIVALGEVRGDATFTTREMLDLERGLLARAKAMAASEHRVADTTIVEALVGRETIEDEQLAALMHVTQGGRLALVRGMAGTGKTFLLEAARVAWEADGFNVQGVALAAIAARRLQEDSGIGSSSIHRLLWDLEKGRAVLTDQTVLVCDEAGLVGTRLLDRLLRAADEAGAKVVLVGDDRQLQAIEAGSPFRKLADDLGAAELRKIRRQKEEWAREAVHELVEGQAVKALARFKERDLFHVASDRRASIAELVSTWEQVARTGPLHETLVLTGTNLDAVETNRAIQACRLAAGELEGQGIAVRRGRLFIGDRVVFRRNTALLRNGDTGRVTRIDERNSVLTVRLDSGRRVSVDLGDYSDVNLGYALTTHSAQGATVRNCLVLCGGSMQDREAAYVQASRATHETRLFTNRETAGEELRDLVREFSRSRAKEMALDVLDGGAAPVLELD